MHPPDFDEPFDPDSWSEKLWAQVPELRWDLRASLSSHHPIAPEE
jgi:hypothetical protein